MMKDLHNVNLSASIISKKYNISRSNVIRKRKLLNVKSKYDNSKIIWTNEMMKDLHNVNLSASIISKKYGISTTTINRERKSLGIISNYSRKKQKTVEGI